MQPELVIGFEIEVAALTDRLAVKRARWKE